MERKLQRSVRGSTDRLIVRNPSWPTDARPFRVFALPVLPAVYLVALRFERSDVGTAFAIGHVSHLLADIPPAALLTADGSALTFLFWPLLEPPAYESVDGISAGFMQYSMGWYEWAQLGLALGALIVWYRDGMPRVGYV